MTEQCYKYSTLTPSIRSCEGMVARIGSHYYTEPPEELEVEKHIAQFHTQTTLGVKSLKPKKMPFLYNTTCLGVSYCS